MRQAIIFDFNRTLFDPRAGRLFPDAVSCLRTLAKRFCCGLITTVGVDRTLEYFRQLGINQYFQLITVVPQKTVADFQGMIESFDLNPDQVYIVGDCLDEEITIGNQLEVTTYWLNRNGDELDELNGVSTPSFTISNLHQLLEHIGGHNVS